VAVKTVDKSRKPCVTRVCGGFWLFVSGSKSGEKRFKECRKPIAVKANFRFKQMRFLISIFSGFQQAPKTATFLLKNRISFRKPAFLTDSSKTNRQSPTRQNKGKSAPPVALFDRVFDRELKSCKSCRKAIFKLLFPSSFPRFRC